MPPKMDSFAYRPFVASLSWLKKNNQTKKNKGIAMLLMTLIGGWKLEVMWVVGVVWKAFACICLYACAQARYGVLKAHMAQCWCALTACAGTSEHTACEDPAAYYMHLTSSHGWSLLPGINHGDLRRANPARWFMEVPSWPSVQVHSWAPLPVEPIHSCRQELDSTISTAA